MDIMTSVSNEPAKLPESVKMVEHKQVGTLEILATIRGDNREDIINPLAVQFVIRELRKEGHNTRGVVEMPIPYPHIFPDNTSEFRADYRIVLNF